MATLQFSEEAARKLQAAYMTAEVIAQRRATLNCLSLSSGEAVLDIGCGPGFLCEEMAEAVGSTGRVLGVDISDVASVTSSKAPTAHDAKRSGKPY